MRREECSCHSSRLVLFLLLHRKRQTSPRIKGRHPKASCCSPRWRSFIYEAYSILPGHLQEAAFQPMLHQFRSAAARFAEPTANIDNVVNVLCCNTPLSWFHVWLRFCMLTIPDRNRTVWRGFDRHAQGVEARVPTCKIGLMMALSYSD